MHFTPLNITSAKKRNLYVHSVHCAILFLIKRPVLSRKNSKPVKIETF